jgi:hypothetical protein
MRPYQSREWHMGWRGTPRSLIFVLSHEKCFSQFHRAEIKFFCEATTETRNRKLGTTLCINNRPPGIYISALVLLRTILRYILDFVQPLADFAWTGEMGKARADYWWAIMLHLRTNFTKFTYGLTARRAWLRMWSDFPSEGSNRSQSVESTFLRRSFRSTCSP